MLQTEIQRILLTIEVRRIAGDFWGLGLEADDSLGVPVLVAHCVGRLVESSRGCARRNVRTRTECEVEETEGSAGNACWRLL